MERVIRGGLVALGAALFIFGVGLAWRQPWATGGWIWIDSARLANIQSGAFVFAIAAPTLWIGLTGNFRAARGASLSLAAIAGGVLLYLLAPALRNGNPRLINWLVVLGVIVIAMLAAAWLSWRLPARDTRPAPALARWAFLALAAVILVGAGGLFLKIPYFMPWQLRASESVVFGWVLLGFSVYYLHGFLWPSWENAAGQLLSILAFDALLLSPWFRHLKTAEPGFELSLWLYLLLIAASGLLALYYLFIDSKTRLWGTLETGKAAPTAGDAGPLAGTPG